MSVFLRALAAGTAAGVATAAYGSLIERNAFTLREFEVPVLTPGSRPIRLLHLSDLHMMPNQRRKQAWIRDLARLKPDLVINTGDHLSSVRAVPALMRSLEPLMEYPGAFVPGNNDYYAPKPKSPTRYFEPQKEFTHGERLPWPAIAATISDAGWHDLTHVRTTVKVGAQGAQVALAGTDDPHLKRARYSLIEGPAEPDAVVRIGVLHSPEPALLNRFAADGYDLVLAGHTHGGQVRVPFGPALVTNCGIDVHRARWLHKWDEKMWFHVCAGLGTSPYMPIRIACRPEASLLTLVDRTD
ncbi:predicted MPP superfamily phosphohydrolase [Jatrophihabitans sp. GAS493]|uniref:metallophosphoesterase n=1 Tax=Jatrophihabitans sp. GAS493 TaxID=1907575 RepID=UPI000BB8D710|nr:metallophosphoesterase [Jatrophihabitans sp. GAS493]SOD71878.1 predicted MPP superfamily phosphohydrolase [Jatrophihabitans sp. GAS493]